MRLVTQNALNVQYKKKNHLANICIYILNFESYFGQKYSKILWRIKTRKSIDNIS